ncbi:DUF922 domain-containing protein [Pseudorhodobacter sp. E13]|uniref:DUF922 domain-containing protein n=1 Tax=Pseudorhodobacter sp. E13 TaxID=2487931 RepID=UPI001315353C|nr:DUF922 domain-containing protein [Pseudorhodobacter sp. E13]
MEVRLSLSPPRRTTYRVSDPTLIGVHRLLDARPEWRRYSGTLQCRPAAARITVSLRPLIELPEWPEYRAASSADQRIWDQMIRALSQHEDNHHAISLRLINDFKADVERATTPMDRRTMRRRCVQLTRDHVAEQQAYDRRSAHGANEGVSLP